MPEDSGIMLVYTCPRYSSSRKSSNLCSADLSGLLVFLSTLLFLDIYPDTMASLRAIALLLLSAISTIATPLHNIAAKRQSSIPIGTIISSCTVPGTVALTFDDGPYIYTDELLGILASNGVVATFFVNGQNYAAIADYASTIQRAANAGHQIGSHTYVAFCFLALRQIANC
jgi:peptidoglycan/xylan/chitin deacetylase (PgdA/CDA1 family)